MKARAILLILAIVTFLLICVFWYDSPSGLSTQALPEQSGEVSEASSPSVVPAQADTDGATFPPDDIAPKSASLIRTIFNQRLTIFGQVVDQDNKPIEGAKVRFGIHDKPWESGSSFFRISDAEGRFEIDGISGAAANTEVSKDGYYNGTESRRVLKPGELTSKESPAIFKLYRKGEAGKLIYRPVSAMELTDGVSMVFFDFKQARLSTSPNGNHVMEVKLEAAQENVIGREWAYQIRIPGGGLQKRHHEFQFIAPESGYSETIVGAYGKNDPDWRGGYHEHLIAKLSDGSVARFEISIGVQRRRYVRIHEIVYNPDPTSRNLELDPAKVMNPVP